MPIKTASRLSFFCILSSLLFLSACGPQETVEPDPLDEFTFTEDDVVKFKELVNQQDEEEATGSGELAPRLEVDGEVVDTSALDVSKNDIYAILRKGSNVEPNTYQVVHTFVNVRSEPRVTSAAVGRLERGDQMTLIEFTNAAWAKVQFAGEKEGFVSQRYIAKLVPEEELVAERESFDGMYYVNFGFLNVRRSADTQAAKLGELPGQAIIKPLHMDEVWARIMFEGQEGYVAKQYLAPFSPSFLVRQENYTLPIVHYRMEQEGALETLLQHVDAIKSAGYSIITLRDFYDLVLAQESKDVRLEPKQVVLTISDVTAANEGDVSDALLASRVSATLFIPTGELGIDGITEKKVLTLLANGFDLQSGSHSGDDLRSLTDSQLALEVRQSRQLLEDMTDKTVFAIAYPLGGTNDRVQKATAEAGYLFGLGASPKVQFGRTDFLKLPSILVSPSMTGDEVVEQLSKE